MHSYTEITLVTSLVVTASCGTENGTFENAAVDAEAGGKIATETLRELGVERTGSVEEANGTIIHEIIYPDSQIVRFWEFEPGETAIEISGNIDEIETPITLTAAEAGGKSLAEIYRMLPRTRHPLRAQSDEVPDEVVAADRRAALRNLATTAAEMVGAEPAPVGAGETSPVGSEVRSACPNDGYWHSWGCDAQWFLSSFCTGGSQHWCPTNVNGWARSGTKEHVTYFEATGCAAGFASTARFDAQYKSCSWNWDPWPKYVCQWKRPSGLPRTLGPRELYSWRWTTTGTRWASIEDSSERVHFAVNWTPKTSAAATPTLTPGPCNDRTEFCCVSSGGGASQYCNNGLTCQAGVCRGCDRYGDPCCIPSHGGASSGYCDGNLTCAGGMCM